MCDLGTSCPYQQEYQHLLEYDHAPQKSRPPPCNILKSTEGRRLGEGTKRRSISISDHATIRKKRCATLGAPGSISSVSVNHKETDKNHDVASKGVAVAASRLSSQSISLQQQRDAEDEESILRDVLKISLEEHLRDKRGRVAGESFMPPVTPPQTDTDSLPAAQWRTVGVIVDLSTPKAVRKRTEASLVIDLIDTA